MNFNQYRNGNNQWQFLQRERKNQDDQKIQYPFQYFLHEYVEEEDEDDHEIHCTEADTSTSHLTQEDDEDRLI